MIAFKEEGSRWSCTKLSITSIHVLKVDRTVNFYFSLLNHLVVVLFSGILLSFISVLSVNEWCVLLQYYMIHGQEQINFYNKGDIKENWI